MIEQINMELGAQTCGACGEIFKSDGFTTGYGVAPKTGARYCFACIGAHEHAQLIQEHAPHVLYLDHKGRRVRNWPGTFSAPCCYWHAFKTPAFGRYIDAVAVRFFIGGRLYYGVCKGNMNCFTARPCKG